MKLQNQVCTFEQAKKLKELGIGQESINYFVMASGVLKLYQKSDPIMDFFAIDMSYNIVSCNYSAFNAAELIQMNEGIGALNFSYSRKKQYYTGSAVGKDY